MMASTILLFDKQEPDSFSFSVVEHDWEITQKLFI